MKKFLIGGVALMIVAAIVFFFVIKPGRISVAAQYRIEAIKKGNVEANITASGTLTPYILVEVGSQVSGRISALYVDFNQKVKANQVLAELDNSDFQAQVGQDQANYESVQTSVDNAKVAAEDAKKKYDRALDLFGKNMISLEEKETSTVTYSTALSNVKTSESKLSQAKAQLEASKVDLGHCTIRSPIDGVVISRNMNIGQTVAASLQAPVLFTIANNLSKMRIECSVNEADIGKVAEGQKVNFTVSAFPGEKFAGSLTQVRSSATVVQNVVTYTCIVDVDNPSLKLRPGMTATASIITASADNVLRVPNSALRFIPSNQVAGAAQQTQGQQATSSETSPTQKARGTRVQDAGQLDQASQSVGRVWKQNPDGSLSQINLHLGVADKSYTEVKEVVSGELKEGDNVVIGLAIPQTKTQQTTQQQPPGPGGIGGIIR
jgi:HlyD family secretion protein